jgi:hypothetical protein
MNATTVDERTVPTAKVSKAKGEAIDPIDLATAPGAVRQKLRGIAVSPWKWLAVSCTILAISGGIRQWRDYQVGAQSHVSKESPFPLNEIPKELDGWRMLPGTDGQLDAETAQIAGASDHIFRQYEHETSGEKVSVLILYGLARTVFAHTADVCSPSVGFKPDGPSVEHELELQGSGKAANYRVGHYSKKIASVVDSMEIVYSFRHDGEWLGDAADRWKKFRTHPGMFKVQIERHGNRDSVKASPSIPLLGDFMQEIDRRWARAQEGRANSASASPGKPIKS